jgi:hypothetical protein
MKVNIIFVLGLSLQSFFIHGQTATEAFRYSASDPTGTARNLGTGNSMFAIGPDFSAIASNPSGLGGYGKSEFLITTNLSLINYSSAFTSDRSNETKGNYASFTLPNIGFIIHNKPRGSSWISSNWAIGLNRVAEYRRDLDYSGNTLGSITDSWRENATGLQQDELNGFAESLAFESGAIYDLNEDQIYETDYSLNDQYALLKRETVIREGGKTELYLGYGADLDHKLLVGFSIGMPIINFNETRRYQEIDDNTDGIPFFNELEYNSSLNTTGYGINAKLGVTVKPTEFLNVAFAFHSPTRLLLSDNFNTTLSYDYTDENNNGALTAESPFGSFQYVLRTPWSASGGIGIIAGKSGFIAAHAKFTDYGSMKYKYDVRGNGNQFEQIEREVNNEINNTYGSALQLNLGGELVLSNYRLRGGASFQQSAFNNDNSFDPSFHAGIGYRGEYFYLDLGYNLSQTDDGYVPYETIDAPEPLVVSDETRHHLAATIGFKF